MALGSGSYIQNLFMFQSPAMLEEKITNSFSDERCPEGPWSCCERNYAITGIDGEDEGGFTVEETGGISQFSWDDPQRFEASFPSQPVPFI